MRPGNLIPFSPIMEFTLPSHGMNNQMFCTHGRGGGSQLNDHTLTFINFACLRQYYVPHDMECISIYESHSAAILICEILYPVWHRLALVRCTDPFDFHADRVFEDVSSDRDKAFICCCNFFHGVFAYKAKAFIHVAIALDEEDHASVFVLIHEDQMFSIWPFLKFDWHGAAV